MGRPRLEDAIDWEKQPLGVVTDYKLAQILGCHPSSVLKARRKFGIGLSPEADARVVYDWDSVQLGVEADEDVALKLGCNRSTVAKRRKLLGIPAAQVPKKRRSAVWRHRGPDVNCDCGKPLAEEKDMCADCYHRDCEWASEGARRVWSALRTLGTCTADAVAESIGTGVLNARVYLRELVSAGRVRKFSQCDDPDGQDNSQWLYAPLY